MLWRKIKKGHRMVIKNWYCQQCYNNAVKYVFKKKTKKTHSENNYLENITSLNSCSLRNKTHKWMDYTLQTPRVRSTISVLYSLILILKMTTKKKKIQQNLYLCENNHNQYTVVYTTVKTHMLILKFCFLLQFIRWPENVLLH